MALKNDPLIIRTMAFVPAHEEDHILESGEIGLDALGMDMEDLTPRSGKQQARDIFRSVAKQLADKGVFVMARTNSIANGAEADLEAIVCPELHCVNMPKAESAEDVIAYCKLLDKAEANNGLPQGYTLVRPVVETAKGIKFAYEIASASNRIAYMGGVAGGFWGDLGATMGMITGDGMESYWHRGKVLVDVRTAGVPFPVGGGMIADRSPEAIRAFATQNKNMGYTGMFIAASKPVAEVVNDVFTPTKEEIEDWKQTIPVLEKAEKQGNVAFKQGDRMFDTAGLGRVKDLMALARRLGLTN
jgi:citrate lyase subunit beta/citryl-CoA lyase